MNDEIVKEETTDVAEARDIDLEEAIEAILFAAGHPITYATLGRVLNITPNKAKEKVIEYSLKYNSSDLKRGITLLPFSDSCQLCTKPYYLPEIRDALGIKRSGSLSTASLEVLAIVAYNQPVTRVFVDTLRRVDSSYAMNNLLDRGLIESTGRLDVPGRPMLYSTTADFLRCFGLNSLDDLPSTTDELLQAFDGAKLTEKEDLEKNSPEQIMADIDSAIINEGDNEQNSDNSAIDEFPEPSAEDDVINN